MKTYKYVRCGATSSFYTFRGVSPDGSYLKCFRCGSTKIEKIDEVIKNVYVGKR
jgi:hypothetical protein